MLALISFLLRTVWFLVRLPFDVLFFVWAWLYWLLFLLGGGGVALWWYLGKVVNFAIGKFLSYPLSLDTIRVLPNSISVTSIALKTLEKKDYHSPVENMMEIKSVKVEASLMGVIGAARDSQSVIHIPGIFVDGLEIVLEFYNLTGSENNFKAMFSSGKPSEEKKPGPAPASKSEGRLRVDRIVLSNVRVGIFNPHVPLVTRPVIDWHPLPLTIDMRDIGNGKPLGKDAILRSVAKEVLRHVVGEPAAVALLEAHDSVEAAKASFLNSASACHAQLTENLEKLKADAAANVKAVQDNAAKVGQQMSKSVNEAIENVKSKLPPAPVLPPASQVLSDAKANMTTGMENARKAVETATAGLPSLTAPTMLPPAPTPAEMLSNAKANVETARKTVENATSSFLPPAPVLPSAQTVVSDAKANMSAAVTNASTALHDAGAAFAAFTGLSSSAAPATTAPTPTTPTPTPAPINSTPSTPTPVPTPAPTGPAVSAPPAAARSAASAPATPITPPTLESAKEVAANVGKNISSAAASAAEAANKAAAAAASMLPTMPALPSMSAMPAAPKFW